MAAVSLAHKKVGAPRFYMSEQVKAEVATLRTKSWSATAECVLAHRRVALRVVAH